MPHRGLWEGVAGLACLLCQEEENPGRHWVTEGGPARRELRADGEEQQRNSELVRYSQAWREEKRRRRMATCTCFAPKDHALWTLFAYGPRVYHHSESIPHTKLPCIARMATERAVENNQIFLNPCVLVDVDDLHQYRPLCGDVAQELNYCIHKQCPDRRIARKTIRTKH